MLYHKICFKDAEKKKLSLITYSTGHEVEYCELNDSDRYQSIIKRVFNRKQAVEALAYFEQLKIEKMT